MHALLTTDAHARECGIVALRQLLSHAPCEPDVTFGCERGGQPSVWTKGGCRGRFVLLQPSRAAYLCGYRASPCGLKGVRTRKVCNCLWPVAANGSGVKQDGHVAHILQNLNAKQHFMQSEHKVDPHPPGERLTRWQAPEFTPVTPIAAGFTPETLIREGITLFQTPLTKLPVLFCAAPKAGSSAWRAMFLKAYYDSKQPLAGGTAPDCQRGSDKLPPWLNQSLANHSAAFALIAQRNVHCIDWPPMTREQISLALNNPRALRIMLVRNPYARLISGFKDKVVARARVSRAGKQIDGASSRNRSAGVYSKRLKNVPIMPDTPSAFGAFALSVFDRRQRNPHFTLQSDACGLAKGLKYQYYLKQENIDDWYSTLINVMELASVASSGWNSSYSSKPASASVHVNINEDKPCFYIPRGRSCANSLEPPSSDAYDSVASSSILSSNKYLQSYFNSHFLVEEATKFFQPDLLHFGYERYTFGLSNESISPLVNEGEDSPCGKIILRKQISHAQCGPGVSFGCDSNPQKFPSIWTQGGCRGKFEVVLPSNDRYFCGWWKSRSPCGRQYVFAKTSCQCYSKEEGAAAALLPAHEQHDVLVRGSTLDARVSFLEQKLDRLLSLLSTVGKL